MKNIQLEHNDHKKASQHYSLHVLAHDLDSPINIGNLFRIADALGIEKLYLSGSSSTPPNRKMKKVARSTDKYVSYEYHTNAEPLLSTLSAQGYTIIALEICSNSIELEQLRIKKNEKVCLVLGSEIEGVSPALLSMADNIVHIPMLGENSSMNVGNACAIASYDIIRKLKSNA